MAEIKNGLGPDHIVREGDTVIKNGIGPDHIVSTIDCGGFQYPPDLTGVDDHVIVASKELTWDMLPTDEDDNGSLRIIDDSHPLYKVYAFDAGWNNAKENQFVPGLFDARHQLLWLMDVLQFRDNQLKFGACAFTHMPATQLTALPDLDTSNLDNMYSMFSHAKVFSQSLDNFDTSNVTDMRYMLNNTERFIEPINHFDTSNVTTMEHMFSSARVFNQPIDNFDTSNVTNMTAMFMGALLFDQNISNWCVEQIAKMPSSFASGANPAFANDAAKQPQWGQPC